MEASILVLALQQSFSAISALIAVLSVLIGAFSVFRNLGRGKDRLRDPEEGITATEVSDLGQSSAGGQQPFETLALANYYNQALSRANVSFWFSILFASIGFGVIIFAFLSHNKEDVVGTLIKVASGTVIDTVSALFFVQSTNAQKSMSEFFEKLRLDRLNAEAREMIGEIENVERRDQLRSQLILKYSGIEKLLVG